MGTLSLAPTARQRVAARLGLAVDPAPQTPAPSLSPEEARRQRRAAFKRLHEELAATFGQCIAPFDRGPVKPLKVGIDRDIAAAVPELLAGREKLLKPFLRGYTSASIYLAALQPGAARVDLAGEPCGTVDAVAASRAAEQLAARQSGAA
jgi:sRNA-binding protein